MVPERGCLCKTQGVRCRTFYLPGIAILAEHGPREVIDVLVTEPRSILGKVGLERAMQTLEIPPKERFLRQADVFQAGVPPAHGFQPALLVARSVVERPVLAGEA